MCSVEDFNFNLYNAMSVEYRERLGELDQVVAGVAPQPPHRRRRRLLPRPRHGRRRRGLRVHRLRNSERFAWSKKRVTYRENEANEYYPKNQYMLTCVLLATGDDDEASIL